MNSSSPIHADALSAWQHLVHVGGIELTGRDEDFEAALLHNLKPTAQPLAEVKERLNDVAVTNELTALLRVTPLKAFLSAFLQVQQPYFLMFRQILRYFEKAGAREGRDHWRLSLPDGDSLDLDHFKTQLTRWKSLKGSLEVPVLDVRSAWRIYEILPAYSRSGMLGPDSPAEAHRIPTTAQYWLEENEKGHMLPLDRDDLQQHLPRQLHSIVDFICAMASVRAQANLSRDQLREAFARRGWEYPNDDALNLWSIAQCESDHYLGNTVRKLFEARALEKQELDQIEQQFRSVAEPFLSRVMNFDVSIAEIENLLQLPIWQKRSELYAVWVGTEIVDCLEGHVIRLFHDDGRLRFDFRETLLAAVLTSRPPVELFGERRTPLVKGPVYFAHTQGVQPDYGIWRAREKAVASCMIAVECKHYKKSGARKFTYVLSDYAHALPTATICLVSHGPIRDVTSTLANDVINRCIVIPELRVDRPGALTRFRACIRKAVGPVTVDVDPAMSMRYGCALVIDASPSMMHLANGTRVQSGISLLRLAIRADVLVGVDTEIRVLKTAPDENLASLLHFEGKGTHLREAVSLLCGSFSRVVVITDEDGLATLSTFDTSDCVTWNASSYPGIRAVEIKPRGQ